MDIQLLGTAAAEGFPAIFCDCEACGKARKAGGRNIRSRSSALIDGKIKIDMCPDSFMQLEKTHGINSKDIEYIFITHIHSDHFAAYEFQFLEKDFSSRKNSNKIQLYGSSDVENQIKHFLAVKNYQGNFTEVFPNQKVKLGENYEVLSLKARHGTPNPLNYIFQKDGKKILYACDTGFYYDEDWKTVSGQNVNLAVVECTGGPGKMDYEFHMGLPKVLKYKKKAEEVGLTNSATKWILTHFSHNCGTIHDEMCKAVEKLPFKIAYDGMKIEI